MPFTTFPTFVRKDPLSAQRVNQLRDNLYLVQETLRAEHVESTGEHNAPHFARRVSTVFGSVHDFSGDVATTVATAEGITDVNLTSAGRFQAGVAPVLVQNASTRGSSLPCISWADWVSDTQVRVMHDWWNGTLGTPGGTWRGGNEEQPYFHLAIHGPALAQPSRGGLGGVRARTHGLRAETPDADWNAMQQTAADLQVAIDVEHEVGVHDIREFAKAWCHVMWTGSSFVIVDQLASTRFTGGHFAAVSGVGTGKVDLVWADAMPDTKLQIFVDVDYSRAVGSPDDYFIACVPQNELAATSCRIYLYQRLLNSGVEYFDRANACDFYVWLFRD